MKKLAILLIVISSCFESLAQPCTSSNTPNLGADKTVFVSCFKDVANLTALYTTTGLTVEWDNASPTAAQIGYHWLVATNATSNCKDTAYITVKQDVKKWLGTVDSNWHNAANWSDNLVPSEKTHVIVFGGTPNPCAIQNADAVAASIRVFKNGNYKIINNRKINLTANCDTLPAYFELGAKTIYVDNPTSLVIQSVDSAQIVFNGNTQQLQNLDTSNIIICGIAPNAPFGFLRKVKDIQRVGNTYTIATGNVSLEETFKELYFDYSKVYNNSDTLALRPLANNSQASFDIPINNMSLANNVSVNGRLEIDPQFSYTIDISGYRLKYAKIEASYARILSLGLNVTGNVEDLSVSRELIPPIFFNFMIVPGVPLVIWPLWQIDIGASGSASVAFNIAETNTSTIDAYVEYKNGNWSSGYSKKNEHTFNGNGITGNADIKVYVEPKVDFYINLSPLKTTLSTKLYLQGKAAIFPKPSCEISAGISADIGVGVDLFFERLSTSYSDTIFDLKTVLYKCYKPKVETSIDCDSTRVGGNVTSDGGTALIARGICWSTTPNATPLDNFKIEHADSLGGFQDTLSPKKLSAAMRLKVGTVYYVRAYAVNQTDTGYGEEYSFTNLDSIFTDERDGEVYKTKKVGEKTWMMEALRFYNPDTLDCARVNHYYRYANANAAVPSGWHIPSLTEWQSIAEIGEFSNPGELYKCTGFYPYGGSTGWDNVWIIGDLFQWVEVCYNGPDGWWINDGNGISNISFSPFNYQTTSLQEYNTGCQLLLIKNN